jgi:very-short-patch-repair endonuclease
MTLAERKLWIWFLQKYNKKWINKTTVLRQKIIDNYIVDFFIPNFKIVIEIDWEIHNDRKEYDKERTQILKWYWLNEIRFTNQEIFENFKDITAVLEIKLKHK